MTTRREDSAEFKREAVLQTQHPGYLSLITGLISQASDRWSQLSD